MLDSRQTYFEVIVEYNGAQEYIDTRIFILISWIKLFSEDMIFIPS